MTLLERYLLLSTIRNCHGQSISLLLMKVGVGIFSYYWWIIGIGFKSASTDLRLEGYFIGISSLWISFSFNELIRMNSVIMRVCVPFFNLVIDMLLPCKPY